MELYSKQLRPIIYQPIPYRNVVAPDRNVVVQILEKELNIKFKCRKELCEQCAYGNSHLLPFGTRQKPTMPGELLTADISGSFE